MPAGTIALTNKSTTVSGTGTSFTTELKAGDFVYVNVGGAPYTLVAANVTSDTQLTLAVAFDGPTATGLAWNAVPASLNMAITQKILNDFASVARGRILDFQNWQAIYSDAASVTVTRPDRTQFAGPSWGYMASQYKNKIDNSKNLSDLADKSSAWKNLIEGRTAVTARSDLGLGSLSTKSSVSRAELDVENFRNLFAAGATPTNAGGAGVWQFDNTAWGFGETYGTTIQVNNRKDTSGAAGGGIWHHYLGLATSGNLLYAVNINGSYASYKMWSTKNTTVDGSGFIKQASPIARVVSETENASPSLTDGFELAGSGAVNSEAEGVTIQRLESGVYRVAGCAGLHADGWQIEVPKDINGNRLCFANVEYEGDDLILHVHKPKLDLDTGGIIAGDSMDIPLGRWIDLRLNMPEDSIYKRKQREFAPSPSDTEQAGKAE